MSGYAITGHLGPFKATRLGVEGTVTMNEGGPQYGAFHPGGDESIVVPIVKWDAFVCWWEPCNTCGEPVETSFGNIDQGGPAHAGCMGYPHCACRTAHLGDCR